MTAHTLVSSSSRSIRVRMRPDLIFVRHTYQGRDYWVVKDPVTLKFYRFEEEEVALLRMLDGNSSPDEIRRRFAFRFAPQKITNQELFQFVGSLFRSSLLVSDAPGQSAQLKHRAEQNQRRQRRAQLTNILAVRFRGFDPDGLLTVLNRFLGWIFSWPTLIGCWLLIVSAAGLILTNFEVFQRKLPAFETFFASNNWIWLGIILALTKVIHEFGHGLACKRFGSQCHSMGIMFLVLMPCLYCDVSDSWTLSNKWKRAAIAAAGMYFEFVLASICAFIWWFSEPGMVNMLALNVVFVCSVSTVLFNANPLLRYDGYYILSDLIEVPNLRQKASSTLRRFCGKWMLGITQRDDPFLPTQRRGLFILYTVAAVVYRWFITLSIFWFVYKLLEPYGLKIIGQAIAMMALYGLIGVPLVQLYKFFKVPGRFTTVKPVRFGMTCAIAGAMFFGVMLIPIPHHVTCSFIVQPQDSANVYVKVPGMVSRISGQASSEVAAGDSLVELASPELLQSIEVLEGQERIARTRYHSTRQRANYDQQAENEVESALTALQAITEHLHQRRNDLEQLIVRAPVAGRIVTASYVSKPSLEDGRLASWHGHPLEKRNLGAYYEQGTLVCQVVPDLMKLEAILAIDQADIEFIHSGNEVKLWIRQLPGSTFWSSIDTISPTEMKVVPKAISNRYGGPLITAPDHEGRDQPVSTTYQVRVPMLDKHQVIVTGSSGIARIRTANQTVGQRIWRFVCKTFRFDL